MPGAGTPCAPRTPLSRVRHLAQPLEAAMSYISKRVMLSLAAAVPLLLASAPAAVLAAPATAPSVSSASGAAPTRQASGTSSCSHDRLRAAGSAPRLLA